MLDLINEYVKVILEYVESNSLYIDKSIYMTVVIGQLTMYGILLTFYQFIASYQSGDQNSTNRYLGRRITEFYVSQKIWAYKIIQNKIFMGLFGLEILTKPILNIYNAYFSNTIISKISFGWYGYVMFYFIVFLLLFVQCSTHILNLKRISLIERNNRVMDKIDVKFLKKSWVMYYKKPTVHSLVSNLEKLRDAILDDDNPRLYDRYNKLFVIMINEYLQQKEREIKLIKNKGKIVKNQIGYLYNANRELQILYDIVHEKYIKLDDKLQRYIVKQHLYFQYLNVIRELLTEKDCNNSFRKRRDNDWEKITRYIYDNSNLETKKYVVSCLGQYANDFEDIPSAIKDNCNDIIFWLMRESISAICQGENEEEFNGIFCPHIKQVGLEEMLADILLDFFVSYDRFLPLKIVEIIDKRNREYIFIYLFLHYSIYSFRFKWKCININLLKKLIEESDLEEIDRQYVLEKIKKSNINRRFKEKMYETLLVNLKKSLTGPLLNRIAEEDLINVNYIFVVKTCVLDQDLGYFNDKMPVELEIELIRFLSAHDEVLDNENIQKFIYKLRWETFSKLDEIPEKILSSFKALVLADIKIREPFFEDNREIYFYINNIGKYALMKVSNDNKSWPKMQDIIRKTYISNNCSVEQYVEQIDSTCNECYMPISYVQKEKMKQYLYEII